MELINKDSMQVVRKKTPEEKQKTISKKANAMTTLELFVASEWFNEFFLKRLNSLIKSYENAIENDEITFRPWTVAEASMFDYCVRQNVNIKIKKILKMLANDPLNTINQLSKSIDRLGSTE